MSSTGGRISFNKWRQDRLTLLEYFEEETQGITKEEEAGQDCGGFLEEYRRQSSENERCFNCRYLFVAHGRRPGKYDLYCEKGVQDPDGTTLDGGACCTLFSSNKAASIDQEIADAFREEEIRTDKRAFDYFISEIRRSREDLLGRRSPS